MRNGGTATAESYLGTRYPEEVAAIFTASLQAGNFAYNFHPGTLVLNRTLNAPQLLCSLQWNNLIAAKLTSM